MTILNFINLAYILPDTVSVCLIYFIITMMLCFLVYLERNKISGFNFFL